MKLSLYYPLKPYKVNQAWGIYNPAYEQFGFNHHNGTDMFTTLGEVARAMCDGKVIETGYNPTGSGKYVIYQTGPVECEDTTCLVNLYYMHADKQLVVAGDKVRTGDPILITDSTGFSTGQHLHVTGYRLALDGITRLDTNKDYDDTFDIAKYFNGLYAEDVGVLLSAEYGETSSNVARIQTKLISLGYPIPAGATGFYGPQTKSAVFAFQLERVQLSWYEQFVLKGSNVGPKTLSALQNI